MESSKEWKSLFCKLIEYGIKIPPYYPCGDYYVAMSEGTEKVEKYTEIMSFDLFYKHFVFNIDKEGYREKVLKDNLQVRSLWYKNHNQNLNICR